MAEELGHYENVFLRMKRRVALEKVTDEGVISLRPVLAERIQPTAQEDEIEESEVGMAEGEQEFQMEDAQEEEFEDGPRSPEEPTAERQHENENLPWWRRVLDVLCCRKT
ncbi:hypothetical protein TNIN_49601 [Trichonephila inaurata madagascariensis]|uniref:Uncharacterized protein n=1 Tax=Trichonephila inaurata madagascariensis TaxID=2747483 RepID=A0A8X6YXW0_9ARAC|nr:hypothetical protein TNIN_49601 [Trichonephila inaurata madagascariensis]